MLAAVGTSLAGLSVARAQGFARRLIILGDEPHRPCGSPPLSKDFLLGTITTEDVLLETADDSLQTLHRVNQQDFDACERCQPTMGSKIYAKGGVMV